MNEIEKLYELAEIESVCTDGFECCNPDYCNRQNFQICPENCSGCEYFKRQEELPPFTAEKQLELIKFLIKNYNYYLEVIDTNNFENSLGESLNDLWQDLTEEEKAEILKILEG